MRKNNRQTTNSVIVVFIVSLLIACTPTLKSDSGASIKAIYLAQEGSQLSNEDLQAHPEVMTTDKFDEFKKLANSKVALWIDINSMGLVDIGWLSESPQKYYPVVLVGNGKDSCVFFGSLQYFIFEVPAPPPGQEEYCNTPRPGFSVNMLTSESGGNMHGYEETPTVQSILDVTNPLLESIK